MKGASLHFKDTTLLQTALTHCSYGQPHNERLEFLGDGILNCVIAASLYRQFPLLPEGDLSRLRAHLVRQETLHQLALEIGLGAHLRLGEGEMRSGGNARPSMLADAFEAIIGALYLDGGFEVAQIFVNQRFTHLLQHLNPEKTLKDPKTRLQEWTQGQRYPLPSYVLSETLGPDHEKIFVVLCQLEKPSIQSKGEGRNRRQAEQTAAALLLTKIESGEVC